ncbi:MAG: aldehyde dehydrogenase family protein [Deltaproteobacteria bacterium]
MREFENFYIGGKWVAPQGNGTIDVISASSEEVIGRVPSGNAADAVAAIAAARQAFDGHWGETSPEERGEWIGKLSGGLQERMMDLATTISEEVGTPIGMSAAIQTGLPIMVTSSYVDVAGQVEWDCEVGNSIVTKEPIGVVAAITPWNYPLHQIMAKVAPAVAAGCTVVVKPSSEAPLNAFVLAEICEAIGLPPGVINIVSGPGAEVGEVMASHPDVDMVSLTGSTTAGRRVMTLAAQTIKRVTLELGGKSANIILDDADITTAVTAGVSNAMMNSGQTCSAWTRMLVPHSKQAEVLEVAQAVMEGMPLGISSDADARLGPLISDAQRAQVMSYIEKGKDEGARLVCGGERPAEFEKGYFVRPTIFAEVNNKMAIAQEEIFGPVLSVIPYESEEEAIAIANDTIYGLAGGVWSGDKDRAIRVARKLRTGQVDINGGAFNAMAPFGGYKQSGLGRELGQFGLEEYFETKSMAL